MKEVDWKELKTGQCYWMIARVGFNRGPKLTIVKVERGSLGPWLSKLGDSRPVNVSCIHKYYRFVGPIPRPEEENEIT